MAVALLLGTAEATMYSVAVSSGTCGSHGCDNISSATACKAASTSLATWQWEGAGSINGYPSLCYLQNGRDVHFNNLTGQSCGAQRSGAACICECPANGAIAQVARREEDILTAFFHATNGPYWR